MPLDSQTVQDFAVALGLATLSGYSLYATAFLTGLAVRFGWLPDLTHDHLLSALGETPSLAFLGCVAAVEFFTGKVRFLGSAWDLLHTLIRPVGAAILAESTLSFLGYGVPPPFPTWGSMLSGTGRAYMLQSPWLALWPGLAISGAVFGFNMLGDALRDVLDPRIRRSADGR